jgi:hypothetical protein
MTAAVSITPTPQGLQLRSGAWRPADGLLLKAPGLTPQQTAVVKDMLRAAGCPLNGSGASVLVLELGLEPPEMVPAARADEYYELDAGAAGVSIRAPAWPGLVHGVATCAQLARQGAQCGGVPGLLVQDWPDLGRRGLFIEGKWGPDRMAPEDWFALVDRMALLKLNTLGIGLYGCWGNCRYEPGPHGRGWPTEFLMVPVPGYPQLRSPKRLRWYSPSDDQWCDESYEPRLYAADFLGDVVRYASGRGVTVVPFVNSLGHNTLIPRLVPEISARSADGHPLGLGYCLSSPATRSFIQDFYTSIVTRYFGGRVPLFHIQMDEVWADSPDPDDPQRRVEPWCQCEHCRASQPEALLQDYVIWLVQMLTDSGVDQVVMWNDQLTRHMDALDQSFVGELRQRGLDDKLILHWWWYSNDELDEHTRVAIGRELGLAGWVAPMTCYFNWQMYSPRLANIELMLRMAHDEGGEGAVSYSVHDPGWTDHEALLAAYAWNPAAMLPWEAQLDHWARGRLGPLADRYLEAVANLREAAAQPLLSRCYQYAYSYIRPNLPFPRSYPGEALEALAGVPDAAAQLRSAGERAAVAESILTTMAATADKDDAAMLRSLQGEAARIRGLTAVFAFLLELHQRSGAPSAADLESCRGVHGVLLDAMGRVESCKPGWVVPATLQAMSALLAFLEQLAEQLAMGCGSTDGLEQAKRRPLSWTLDKPYCGEVEDGG